MSKVNNKVTRMTFCCLCCLLWTYFTPFSSVLIVDFKHVSVSGSHPIKLKTLKLLTAATINRCTKIFVKWQLIKKDSDPKYLFLKNMFSLQFTVFNSRVQFFQSIVFLNFKKVVAAIYFQWILYLFQKSTCIHELCICNCI